MQPTRKSFHEQPTLMSYKVQHGTRDSGRKYEFKMAALLPWMSVSTQHDMRITSNAPEVGAFDDVVPQLGNVTYLLQLKHNPKPLTKPELGASKGDFALVNHLNHIKQLKGSLHFKNEQSFKRSMGTISNIYFVIFTNSGINDCDFLKQSNESVLDILNTESDSVVHRVNVTKLPGSSYAEEIDNYNNVYILNNQIGIKTIDDKIREGMGKVAHYFKLCPPTNISEISERFTRYVTDWAEGSFNVDYLLTKTEILQEVSELFLNKYEINCIENKFKCFNCTKKLAWNNILNDKKNTLVEDGDNILAFIREYISTEVQKYCVSHSNSVWSTNLSDEAKNAFYKKHAFLQLYLRKIVRTSNIINYFDIYKCLWTAAEMSLLVEVSSSDHYNDIVNILQLSNSYHKVVVIYKVGSCLLFEEDFEHRCFFNRC